MASAGNPDQRGGAPFDMHKPSTPSPTPPVSASPTGGGGMPYSLAPRGRSFTGDHIYDIDDKSPMGRPLDGTTIVLCDPGPGLVLGRQFAIFNDLICYVFGVCFNRIRVCKIDTAFGPILNGHDKRITDMAFFSEDVALLASASGNGRVCIWEITEGKDEDGRPQITSQIVIAIQIVGEGESVHPRVCWHCCKQEILFVGMGTRVLKIDTTKVGKGELFLEEKPLRCPVDRLVDSVQLVGTHDGEVTDISMFPLKTTFLVSASVDGTIKVWEDYKSIPTAILKPHDGQPVNFVTFLAAPIKLEHFILITGGQLNREVKIWSSASEEGSLVPSDAESWRCTQKLKLTSSVATRVVDAFFNQVVAFSEAGLLLLANAKKNAIYAVHIEYGPNPAATRMDYIADLYVTTPIFSFIGTLDMPSEQIVEIYCLQNKSIEKYALDLSQCLRQSSDALRDYLQKENAKLEELLHDHTQKITSMISNCIDKDKPGRVENIVKELSVKTVTPIVIGKVVSSAISEAFQRFQVDLIKQVEDLVEEEIDATVRCVIAEAAIAASSAAFQVRRRVFYIRNSSSKRLLQLNKSKHKSTSSPSQGFKCRRRALRRFVI